MFGNERFDEDVWNYLGGCNDKQKFYKPEWKEVDDWCQNHPEEVYENKHIDGDCFTPRDVRALVVGKSSSSTDKR